MPLPQPGQSSVVSLAWLSPQQTELSEPPVGLKIKDRTPRFHGPKSGMLMLLIYYYRRLDLKWFKFPTDHNQ